jgi:hypothetical protein
MISISGIPCAVKSRTVRRAIRMVLAQIRERAPAHFERIRSRVVMFRALPRSKQGEGTVGEFVHPDKDSFNAPGKIEVAEDADNVRHIVATVAHELGHACTSEKDFNRHDSGDSEWASELCADHYAYRWGFGRWIARHRPFRYPGHSCAAPRTEFTEQRGGLVYRSRVTRTFRIKLIQTETPDGELVETAEQIAARRRLEREEWESAHGWAETAAAMVSSIKARKAKARKKGA